MPPRTERMTTKARRWPMLSDVLRLPIALTVAVLVALGACSSSDGRELPEPKDSATTTSSASSASSTAPAAIDGVAPFSLTSPAVAAGGELPERHTCTGDDVSPPLSWSGAPPAASFAVVVRDLSADGFVHWVVAGIDGTVIGLGDGGIPEGAVEAMNGFGGVGWAGPCPPTGSGTHTYAIVLHVLAEPAPVDATTPAEEAADLVEGLSTAHAELQVAVTAPG